MGILRCLLFLVLALPCLSQEKRPPEPAAPARSSQEGGAQPDEKIPSQKTVDAILARINHFRKLAGANEIIEDKDLSSGCQLHAEYMRQNTDILDGEAHTEFSDRLGYSEQGKKSASRSVINQGCPVEDPSNLVNGLVSTLYHRPYLIAPTLRKVGIGYARYRRTGYVVVIDTATRPKVEFWDPLIFPAANQKEVPLRFGGEEWPNPIPDKSAKAGYPITVIVSPHGWQLGSPEMTLTTLDGVVDCWFSSPEKPARKDWPQTGIVCLIPRQPLKPNAAYTVTFSCKQIGIEKTPVWTKTWSFTTAAK